jgi:hypothetical protein
MGEVGSGKSVGRERGREEEECGFFTKNNTS